MSRSVTGEILVVEDNPADLKLMTGILVDAGYQVRPASDGALALRSLKVKLPDLILLDVNLPDMLGVEVCLHLKESPETRDVPVIFISALDESQLKVQALEAGGTDYITKPIEESELLARINTHLKMHRLQQELIKQSSELKREIKEREHHQESSRESEERLRTAFEAADDCIIIWDQEYNYLYANKAAIEHVGSTSDQVIGKNIRDGLGHIPDFMHLWMSRVDQVFATGDSLRVQDETTLKGRKFFTDSIIKPLRAADGSVDAVYVVYRDITGLKEVENKLKEANDIVNRSPAVAILWANSEGWPVEYVSDNVVNLLGYTSSEFLSGEIPYANLIHPDDLSRVTDEVILFSNKKDSLGFTHEPYRLIARSGDEVWVDDRTTMQRDSQGNITHYQGIILDITEKVKSDQERQRLENSLYQSDKMASIGQLSAGVAHEVNNPMGFIFSNLKTMTEYVLELKQHFNEQSSVNPGSEIGELFEDFEEALTDSLEGAQRVKKIVSDMMGVSSPGSGNLEQACLHDGIDSTLNIVGSQVKDKFRIVKDFGDIPQVQCYKSKINQVFLNLLVNAGHATENISGVIQIKTWADDDEVHVSIKDNGRGIPKENLPKLFDAFYTTKEVGQGTGLGLSLSRDIVHQHGGSITVKSEIGQGTEFVVSLPIVAVAVPQELPVV